MRYPMRLSAFGALTVLTKVRRLLFAHQELAGIGGSPTRGNGELTGLDSVLSLYLYDRLRERNDCYEDRARRETKQCRRRYLLAAGNGRRYRGAGDEAHGS